MKKRGFLVFEFCGDVASEAEVRVLIYGAGDEARDVGRSAVDLRE